MDLQILGAASLASISEFGGLYRPQATVVTVDNVQVKPVPANPNRVSWLIYNLGTTSIYLSPVPGLLAGQGVPLVSAGSFFGLKVRDDADSTIAEWYAIGSAVGGSVLLIESVKYASGGA